VPETGRYALQGVQLRAGVELWAARTGARLLIEDDRSSPQHAIEVHARLLARGCAFVLGPYGGDCTRAVARAAGRAAVWNHGAAADDVQRLPAVVSVCSPASRYLVALARAVVALGADARVAVVTTRAPFGRLAREGFEREAPSLGVSIAATFSFVDATEEIAAAGADAVLACGPLERELELFRALRLRAPQALLGGVSPGLSAFPAHLGQDPEGMLAVAQWYPGLAADPRLGPSSSEVVGEARARGVELDYVGAQAYAAALIAARCHELAPDDPRAAARMLRTTTFYGAFELDPASGIQRAHRLCVLRWRGGRQELLLASAA
jgi:ABC-type branched-subunit amino acid transport system substrate-binding protein